MGNALVESPGYQVLKRGGELLVGTQFDYRGDLATIISLDGSEVKIKLSDTVKVWRT